MGDIGQEIGMGLGRVEVFTSTGRGATPEELADRALARIIYIGEDAPPVLREQVEAFRGELYRVLLMYLHEAVRGNKVTLANRFREAGCPELIPLLDT
jgi:hypothetical protein